MVLRGVNVGRASRTASSFASSSARVGSVCSKASAACRALSMASSAGGAVCGVAGLGYGYRLPGYLLGSRFERRPCPSGMHPVGDITVEHVGMEGYDFVPGGDPCQRSADLPGMLVAGRVIVGQHDDAGTAQGLTVTGTPFPCAHGIAGGSQPESVQGLGVFFALDHVDGLAALDRRDHLRQMIEDGFDALQVPQPCPGVRRVRSPLPEGFRGQAHGLVDQYPVGIDIVVGRDDAAVPVVMDSMARGSTVDKEIPPGQVQRGQNGVQGTLSMAIKQDFVSGGRNTQTRGMIVMGRAAGLPLLPVLPGLRTAVRNRCGQGSGIGAGREYGIH